MADEVVDEILNGMDGSPSGDTPVIINPVDNDAGDHTNDNTTGHFRLSQTLNNMSNLSNSAEHNLRLAKARKERTKVQNFVADVCGVDPDKKMTKLNTLGSVIWMGAKFGIASAIFGPLVGGWMLAHMTNHDYYAKKEGKYIDLVNSLLFDSILMSPLDKDYANKFGHLSPRHKEEASK